MTYALLVQNDRPLGYWPYLGADQTSGSNNFTGGTGVKQTTPPLVNNNSYAINIVPGASALTLLNKYDTFYKYNENTALYFEFWFSFNALFDGSGYLKNLSSASQYYVSNKLNILRIMTGSTEIGSIYYDYNKNTIRFNINGTDNTEAYFPLRNLNRPLYITAGYKNKSLSISVNGEDGVQGTVLTTSTFPDKNSASVNFVFDSLSLNSSASSNYVVSDFAIYKTPLLMRQKRKRVVWATYNDKPTMLTLAQGTAFFDTYENATHVYANEYINGEGFNYVSNSNNNNVDPVFGLAPINVSNLVLNNPSGSITTATYSSSGVQINGPGSINMNNFGYLLDGNNTVTISTQINFLGSSSVDYIFGLMDQNSRSLLYATIQKNGYYINSYNVDTGSVTNITSISTTIPAGEYNFAFSYNSGSYYLYGTASSGVSASSYASSSVNKISINNDTQFEIGNVMILSSKQPTFQFKNFGITYVPYIDFSTFDFTENKFYMARLTGDLSISQISDWIKIIPMTTYGINAIGAKVTWDGMDNCLVQASNDYGVTWTNVQRGTNIPNVSYRTLMNDVLIKVRTPYEYKIESEYQSFNEMQVIVYRNNEFYSKDNLFYMYGLSDNSGSISYTMQRTPNPINFRKYNFGLNFDKLTSSSIATGYAAIISSSAGAPLNIYGIDFWFKINDKTSASGYLISDASGSVNLYYNHSNQTLSAPTGSFIINGNTASVYSGSVSASIAYKTFNHLMFKFPSMNTSSVLYINALGSLSTSSGVHNSMSIGYINLYKNTFSIYSASTRYNAFVKNNITQITDSQSSTTQWQPDWAAGYIGAASAYKIGTV